MGIAVGFVIMHHPDYMNALRNSEFYPKQLKVEDVEDGYENCSYIGKDQERRLLSPHGLKMTKLSQKQPSNL